MHQIKLQERTLLLKNNLVSQYEYYSNYLEKIFQSKSHHLDKDTSKP